MNTDKIYAEMLAAEYAPKTDLWWNIGIQLFI